VLARQVLLPLPPLCQPWVEGILKSSDGSDLIP
jgi:hypothetical protein